MEDPQTLNPCKFITVELINIDLGTIDYLTKFSGLWSKIFAFDSVVTSPHMRELESLWAIVFFWYPGGGGRTGRTRQWRITLGVLKDMVVFWGFCLCVWRSKIPIFTSFSGICVMNTFFCLNSELIDRLT
jgi:hypothetical protein